MFVAMCSTVSLCVCDQGGTIRAGAGVCTIFMCSQRVDPNFSGAQSSYWLCGSS